MNEMLDIILRLGLAAISGASVGYERGAHGRAAGLRTHMLISIGSAMTVLVGEYITASGQGDPSRIASGVVSGIGFLGAGTILLKGSNKITGLTTAAAMWATAAIGLAYGAGYYKAGICGTVMTYFILTCLIYLEARQKRDNLYYIEIEDAFSTNRVFYEIKQMFPVSHSSDILPSKSKLPGHVGISINIKDIDDKEPNYIEEKIRQIPGVVYIVRE